MAEVFISYSHKDEAWKERLQSQLAVLELEGLLSVWEDRQIAGGDDWQPQIEAAIASAQVAILLISADFLGSKFIRGEEVPRLLGRRAKDGLRVIPLILRPCPWQAVKWLSAIQGRPKDNKPLSGFTDHDIETHLSALALEIQGLIAVAASRSSDSGAEPPGGESATAQPVGITTHHERMVIKLLANTGGLELLEAIQQDLANEHSDLPAPQCALDIVKLFKDWPSDAVESLFFVVRRALGEIPSSAREPAIRLQAEEAAAGLYCIAACQLVDRAVLASGGHVMRVPTSERVICAIIATSLFGGELRLLQGEASSLPGAEYVYQVSPNYGGDQILEDFERAAYLAVFGGRRDETGVSQDTGPLTAQQRKDLEVRLRSIKKVRKASLALVVTGRTQTGSCGSFAATHEVPVMLPVSDATTALIGMDANALLSHINEFWSELQVMPRGSAAAHAQPSAAPSQGSSVMSSHTHNYYGPVAQTSGEHSPAQAGERNSQTLNHTECADLSALSPVLMQLLDAIGEVPSPRARERLTEHVQAAQREVAKTDKSDPGRIKAALDAIESGADVLENSGKIIGLCNKAYQFLAPFLGLPPSPLP